MKLDREVFEKLYTRFNKFNFIEPDPLQFLHRFDDVEDRALVGLVASGLAYGRVASINQSIEKVLTVLGETPSEGLSSLTNAQLVKAFKGFKHRWTNEEEMVALLWSVKKIQQQKGLESLLMEGYSAGDETVLPAAAYFYAELLKESGLKKNSLLPQPSKGSASKRAMLFLRWMLRKDAVDPGGWEGLPAAKLIMPLDTHIFYISKKLGFTKRKSPDLKSAMEITAEFKKLAAEDPCRYDFALSRLGIRAELSRDEIVQTMISGG